MKTIKSAIALIALFSVSKALSAQEYKLTTENVKTNTLVLNDFKGKLPIEGYAGTDIIITTTSGDFKVPEKAKGLKPVFGGGTDNTGLGLSVTKTGNEIDIQCLLAQNQGDGEYKIKVPNNLAIKLSSDCGRDNSVTVENMNNEVDIKTCEDINLKNVSGPVVLSTINGNVNVTFGEMPKDKPTSITCINGEIDVTLPAKTACNLEMSAVSGNLYTDFDLPQDKDMKRVGGNKVKAQLNGGGAELTLRNINGNIYLRKG